MSIEIQNLDESVKKINVEMPKDETQKYFEEILKKEAKKLTIPGFRKGRAPISLVKKMYGEALFVDNLDKIAQNKFWDEMDNQGIEVIGIPKLTDLNLKDDGGLKFEIQFEVLPQIQIEDFENLEIEKEEFEFSDKFYEEVIEYVRFELRSEEPLEKIDSMDCLVDLEVIPSGENQEKGTSNKEGNKISLYLKNTNLNQEFVNLILNKNLNDEFETSTPFAIEKTPGNINDAKTVAKKYRIVSVKKVNLPEANDDLAKNYTKDKIQTLEELKKEFAEKEHEYLKSESNEKFKNAIREAFLNKFKFQPPPSMVEKTTNFLLDDLKKKYKTTNLNEETIEMVKRYAFEDVRWYLIKQELKRKFNLNLTPQEIEEYAQNLANKYQAEKETILKYLYSNKSNLLSEKEDEKFYEFIISKIKIIPKKVII